VTTQNIPDPSAAGPQAQTFKDYLRLLWGRKWLILLIVVVVTGGVEFLALQETPVYQSHARVVVPPPPPVIVNGVIQPQPRTEEFLATQAEVIASPEVATLVVQDLNLNSSPESLSRRIKVDPIPNTDILRIFISASNAKQTADLANSVVDQYLQYRHQTDKRSLLVQKHLITKRVADDQAQLDELKTEDQTNPQVIARQNSLLADLNVQRNKLADLQQALATVETGGSVLEAAHVPSAPVSPDKVRSGIVGFALGLLLGIAAAFVLEYFRDNLASPAEVERIAGASVLALVPEAHRSGRNPLLVTEDDARRPLTESFRTLRTNLLFLATRDHVKTLIVTSPAPGDGKTTVCANLAISLTQAGYQVVLIDGDLRKPRIHAAFGLDNRRGLTDVLLEGASVADVVVDAGVPNLRVIPSGRATDQPTELLGGPRMRDVVEACKQAADFVIIDSPPVVAVADPSVLAMNSDGIIVVMTQETGRRTLTQARTQLQKVGARILGVVVNRVESTRRGYYYYDYYYPYYSQQQADVPKRRSEPKRASQQSRGSRHSGF